MLLLLFTRERFFSLVSRFTISTRACFLQREAIPIPTHRRQQLMKDASSIYGASLKVLALAPQLDVHPETSMEYEHKISIWQNPIPSANIVRSITDGQTRSLLPDRIGSCTSILKTRIRMMIRMVGRPAGL